MVNDNNLGLGLEAFGDNISKAFSNDLEKGGKPTKKSGEPMTITDRRSGKQITGMWRTMGGNKVFVSGDGKIQVGSEHVKDYAAGKESSGGSKGSGGSNTSSTKDKFSNLNELDKKRKADPSDENYEAYSDAVIAMSPKDQKEYMDTVVSPKMEANKKAKADAYMQGQRDKQAKEDAAKKPTPKKEAPKAEPKGRYADGKMQRLAQEAAGERDMDVKVTDMSIDGKESFMIEPTGMNDAKYEGMVVNYENGVFTVEEMQAGKNEEAIFEYGKFKSLSGAMNQLKRGNNVSGGTKVKSVYDMGGESPGLGEMSFKDYQNKDTNAAKDKAREESKSAEQKAKSKENSKKVAKQDKEAGKKYDKNAAPIREGDTNPEKFKGAPKYKGSSAANQKSADSIFNFSKVDQSKMSKEDKAAIAEIMENAEDLVFMEKEDLEEESRWESQENRKATNDWLDKHKKSVSGSKLTTEGLMDAVGTGVFDQLFSKTFAEEVSTTFDNVSKKYSMGSDPDQLRLFKSIDMMFDILGV
jgi:hypothetical protein